MSTIDPQNPSLEAVTDLETADGSDDDATEVATADTSHFLHHPRLIRYAEGVLRRYGVQQQDMPDVLCDVQTDALEAARMGAMPTDLWTWTALVATIAYRTAIDRLGMLTMTLLFLAMLQVPLVAVVERLDDNVDVAAPAPKAGPTERAPGLRAAGMRACHAAAWSECLTKLDEARAVDPRGDDASAVQEARAHANEALREGTSP